MITLEQMSFLCLYVKGDPKANSGIGHFASYLIGINAIVALVLHIRIEVDNRKYRNKHNSASIISRLIDSRMKNVQAHSSSVHGSKGPGSSQPCEASTTTLKDVRIILVEPIHKPETESPRKNLEQEATKQMSRSENHYNPRGTLIHKHGYSIWIIRAALGTCLTMMVLIAIMLHWLSGNRSRRLLVFGVIITIIIDIVMPIIIVSRNDALASYTISRLQRSKQYFHPEKFIFFKRNM